MKANEMQREELQAFIESDAGRAFLKELDAGWDGVMALAEERGFVAMAGGGAAVLSSYGAAMEATGAEGVVGLLIANGVEVTA